jgi:D-alanyl-D-alanine carboxypeptidase/D-alanyl-D-alanine-endopeptidase (penicillin-binding protein 4)
VTPTPQEETGRRRWQVTPGLVAALATVLVATAIAIVVTRSDGTGNAATVAAVRQVIVPPPATTPPTEAPAPPVTAPVAPVTTPPSTAATPPAPPRPALPRPAVAAQPAPPPVPLTLTAALQQAMAGVNGCLVVEDDDGALKTLFDLNGGSGFVPASSQKVLVAAAVLSRLGPDYRFETKVMASRPADDDGALHDAWLVGGGDPYLATPDYAAYLVTKPRTVDTPLTPLVALADELVAAGVRSIPAGLQTDESRYPPQRSVPTWKPSYVSEAEVGSLGALTVNEGLAGWGPNQKVAPDPAVSAANALGRLLTDRGVSLPGPTAGASAPLDAVVIATVRSAPLGQIVAGMLRASDNYVAEMLVKALDRHSGGPGLTAGGTARVVDELGRLGVPVDGVHLNDGSGLDVGNRATCRALLGALKLSRQARFSMLDSGLAIAGRTGTLAKRYIGSPAEIRLAAKTGWINGAAAMAGRIALNPTRRFALIFNGQFGWPHAQAVEDRVVAALTGNLPL